METTKWGEEKAASSEKKEINGRELRKGILLNALEVSIAGAWKSV